MLKSILFILIMIIFSFKLYAFTQDRIFIITPSVSGSYSPSVTSLNIPSVALDASYSLSDSLEAGIGISAQELTMDTENYPRYLKDQKELAIPIYMLIKSNILIDYKNSVSFYAKIGTVLGAESTVFNYGSSTVATDMDLYAGFGVDYIYKNMVMGVEYKTIGYSHYNTINKSINFTDNSYNSYIGLRLGYNIYTKVTPVVE